MDIIIKAKIICRECGDELEFDFTKEETTEVCSMECKCKMTSLLILPKERAYMIMAHGKYEDNSESVYVPYKYRKNHNDMWRG